MQVDGGGGGAAAETAVRKGPWTMEEDLVLANYVAANGEGSWNSLARTAGLNRTGKSCRLRWLNYLRPDVRRGNITPEEHLLIVELQGRWGNRWSKIARHLPGRTDNEIKNFWRTKIQKKRSGGREAGTSQSAGSPQGTAPAPVPLAVTESQASSTNSAGRVPDYDVGGQPRGWLDRHHHLAYGGHGGGAAGVCAGGVPPEFLQAAVVAAGDSFWGFEEFWPTVPSLQGDC